MRPRTVAILALVVAALAAFVVFVERDLPSTDARRERAGQLVRLEPDEVTRLAITWQGAEVRLERADAAGEWRLVAPPAGRADRARIERLLANLSALAVERSLDGAVAAEVGLAPPRGRVEWSGGGEGWVDVGGAVPASSNVVVAAAGRQAPAVVAAGFTADLEIAPGDWRSRDVLGLARDRIERLRLLPRHGEAIELVRRGEGFVVATPFADAADRDRVDPLLSELTGLRAERFGEAPLPAEVETALASGPGSIELEAAGEAAPRRLDVGAEAAAGERWMRLDGKVFLARSALASSFEGPSDAWRSPRWSGFDAWQVERIRISEAAGELTLVREGGDWKSAGAVLPYTEAGDLLHELTSLRAARLLPPAEATGRTVAPPQLTIVLADAAGGEETLTLHAPAADATLEGRASGRAVALLLPVEAVAALRARIAALREAARPTSPTDPPSG